MPLIKSVIQSLAKISLIPLGLTATAAVADAVIHKKILGFGHNTTLIISNNEVEDIIKIFKMLEDSGLLLERVSEAIKNEVKEQKGEFLSMLLGAFGASLLGDMLVGIGIVREEYGSKGKGISRADYGSKKKIESTTSFKIQKHYQNKPRFNGVYSRDNLHDNIKDGVYVINLDEYSNIENQ